MSMYVRAAPAPPGHVDLAHLSAQYSETVIEQMSARHADKPEMEWKVMDVLALDIGAESFDLVIDKGMFKSAQIDPPLNRYQGRWSELRQSLPSQGGLSLSSAMLTTKGDPWVRWSVKLDILS